MNTLKVEAFLKELGTDTGGQSRPVLIQADDGNQYILKNQNVYIENARRWGVWDSMFLQELLASKIAAYLDVPIPEYAIIDVEKDFLDNAPALAFQYRYNTGLHFGSRYIDTLENNKKKGFQMLMQLGKPYTKTSWNSFFRKITNPKDAANIIAMDLLIGNFDRFGNDGNMLISKEDSGRKIIAIDHGHAFCTASWNNSPKKQFLTTVENTKGYQITYLQSFYQNNGGKFLAGLGEIFRAIEQHIDVNDATNHDFSNVVYKIENIGHDIIDSWFKDIPDMWFVDKNNQISLYKKFILTNKHNIRDLINLMISFGAFSNSNGGMLGWKEAKTGTQ